MKKILSLALALAMIAGTLALASCENGKEETTTSTTTAGTTTSSATTTSTNPGDPAEPAKSTESAENTDPDPEIKFDEHAEGAEAVAQLVGSSINLMDDYLGDYLIQYSINKNFDWTEDPDKADLGNEAAPNILDNNPDTKWCCGRTDVEFCSSVVWSMAQEVTVTHYVIRTANDNEKFPGRNAESWRLYGTNVELSQDMVMTQEYFDSEDYQVPEGWELIDWVQDSDLPDSNFTDCGFSVDNPAPYKYYMLLIDYCDYQDGCFQMSDFNLYGTAD
ncbi:MAG: hypothetical protein ACI3XR_00975 [Eubacteriales bacterium]